MNAKMLSEKITISQPRKQQRSQCPFTSLKRSTPSILLTLGVVICSALSALAETYTLTEINPPAASTGSSAESVNNLGQVVGNTSVKSGRSNVAGPAFVWTNGASVSLPTLSPARAGHASAISDSGMIVGHSGGHAVWWQPAAGGGYDIGDWNDLLPEGSPLSLHDTVAISADGQFVVFDAENTATGLFCAAVARVESGEITTWRIDSGGTPFGPLSDSLASDIDHDGATVRVVGFYAKSINDAPHAFLWEKDIASGTVTMIDLDTLNRPSFGDGVNDAGEVAGNIEVAGNYQAHFWNAAGAKQQLPTLGGTRNYARSINSAGSVVGWSHRSGKNATAHAFLWHLTAGMRDLNTLKSASDTSGIELTNAGEINDVGQILARGVRKNAGMDVLLKPIP